MALTSKSLASAAKRRVDLAREHVHDAEGKLDVANKELEESIPSGDLCRIESAHVLTQRAEHAVTQASAELDVATELLAEGAEGQVRKDASGTGVRSLMESLRSRRKQ